MNDTDIGQGRAVANTLMGMGGMAVVAAGVALVSKLELKFIDATGMAAFGVLMIATGVFQHWLVRPTPAPVRARHVRR